MKPLLVSPAPEAVESVSYANHIPDYAEHELARLHAGRYSSLPHFEIYGLADQASTYVARRDQQTTALLLYRRDGDIVRVLNEGIPLSLDDVRHFVDHLFQRADAPSAVLLRAVDMATAGPLVQRVPCEQDAVLPLPAGKDAYLHSLGQCTRNLIKNRLNKLRREHPGFVFHIAEQAQADPQHVRAILALHRQRARSWRRRVEVDAAEEQRILHMVARCGLVTAMTIDGVCCAGAICYRNGGVVSARFLAHDPAYDLYRLGFLCAYLTCSACTEDRGLKQFNFGWGKQPYKFRLGAQTRTLSDVVIYRDRLQWLRLAPLSLKLTLRGWHFQLRQWLRGVKT